MQSPDRSPQQQTRHSESESLSSGVAITSEENASSFNYLSSPLVTSESHKKLIIISTTTEEGDIPRDEEQLEEEREEEEEEEIDNNQQLLQQKQEVVCKVYFKERNEIRRFKLTDISWNAFILHISKLFKLDPNELNVRYTDDEGDLITISTDSEFKEIFNLKILNKQQEMQETGAEKEFLKFYINLKATPLPASDFAGYDNSTSSSSSFISREGRRGGRKEEEDSLVRNRQKFREKQRKKQEKEDFKSQKKAYKRQKKLHQRRRKACQKMIKSNELYSRFIKHITIPDDTILPPGTAFIKTWKVRNEGTVAWPAGTLLKYLSREVGSPFGGPEAVPVGKVVEPGESIDISVEITSPSKVGTHTGFWKLCTEEGLKFGQRLWCKVQVKETASLNEKNNNDQKVVEVDDDEEEEDGEEEEVEKAEEMNALLNKLSEMGFIDEDRNREMIKKCGADLENVIAALSSQNLSYIIS